MRFQLSFALFVGMLLAVTPARAAERKFGELAAELNTTNLQPGQQAVIAVVFDVKEGFHTQSHTPSNKDYIPFVVELEGDPRLAMGSAIYPTVEDRVYGSLGKLNAYTGRVIVYVPIEIKADAAAGDLKIKGTITYQACDDNACYQKVSPTLEILTKIVAAGESSALNKPELFKDYDAKAAIKGAATQPVPPTSPQAGWTFFGRTIAANSYPLAFSVALLIGIIFNVMPCVLPVLPLKAIGFYETSQHNRGKSFLFGLVFSLGIVATFAFLALLVLPVTGGAKGGDSTNWGQWFSKSWIVWPLVAILIAMGLGMFGLFTFRLPVGVYTIDPKHDSYTGNFLFGILTAVLSTPCTAPLFPGLLVWAAAQSARGGRFIGVTVIILVGVGMALPYLLLSALPELARKLPRTGPWSELVKQLMAFMLFGVAAYFIGQRLLAGNQFLWLVFAVAISASMFLLVRTAQLMPRLVPMAVSAVISLAMCGGTFALARSLNQQPLEWGTYSQTALDQARQEKRTVLVEFTAKWCLNCQYVEVNVFHDKGMVATIQKRGVVLLRADLTTDDAPGWELLKKLNPSGGIPLTAIYAPRDLEPALLASIYTKQTLIDALDKAK